jgi:serine/threonine-protein kinase RsbW
MRMTIAFWLPRRADSVSVARHILDKLLYAFGVQAMCREEIALAVTEACSNAVRHAKGQSSFEVAAESDDDVVTITVNDDGPGIAPDRIDGMPEPNEPHGRGIALMRVTTDAFELRRRRSGGVSVRLFKRLRWLDGAVGREGG